MFILFNAHQSACAGYQCIDILLQMLVCLPPPYSVLTAILNDNNELLDCKVSSTCTCTVFTCTVLHVHVNMYCITCTCTSYLSLSFRLSLGPLCLS